MCNRCLITHHAAPSPCHPVTLSPCHLVTSSAPASSADKTQQFHSRVDEDLAGAGGEAGGGGFVAAFFIGAAVADVADAFVGEADEEEGRRGLAYALADGHPQLNEDLA